MGWRKGKKKHFGAVKKRALLMAIVFMQTLERIN